MHYTQQKGVKYDFVPEVHQMCLNLEVAYNMNQTDGQKASQKVINFELLKHKHKTLTNFMIMKNNR